TVLVRDSVAIDPRIRKIARDHAIRILNQAGIELRWIDADGSEDPHLTSTSYLTVVIGAQPLTGCTTQDAMGFAPAGTGRYRRAYVFSTSITKFLQRFASQGQSSYGIILGHVIVHELGHLLISGNAHGNGIMRPRWAYPEWQQAAKGNLLF